MATSYSDALNVLGQPEHLPLLARINRGIEKEGLRCSPSGVISQAFHPAGLGSKLTHPSITTDYSEALLEFITPVFNSAHEALAFLDIAHRYSYSQLDGELIWPSSMPCIVRGDESVPIADYGSSNVGQLKHVYRHGLWHRYGRTMQCIAGIHYNFSLPDAIWPVLQQQAGNEDERQDFVSARYFGLIRNFRRYSWLLLYLFGASPAVCETFLEGRQHQLQRLYKHTLYAPHATSLRMSDLGYQNNAQSSLIVCYNKLDSYVETLGQAIGQPVKAYQDIGIQDEQGHYKQLNTNLLQIENEYYSDVRPKRVTQPGEKPLQALSRRGVEYIEVRCTDVNPFLPLGLDVPQMSFMDTFLVWCLLQDSPPVETQEYKRMQENQRRTVMEGRLDGLQLYRSEGCIDLRQWGMQIIDSMQNIAAMMDKANGHTFHSDALAQQTLKLADSELTPSAQVLSAMEEHQLEFAELSLLLAKQHRKTLSEPLASPVQQEWHQQAQQSLAEQQQLEASPQLPFDVFLQQYLES